MPLIASYVVGTAESNALTLTSPTFTPAPGELIVAKMGNQDDDQPALTGVVGGGLAWAARAEWRQITGNFADAWIYAARVGASPRAMAVSSTWTAATEGPGAHAMIVERWTNVDVAARPATNPVKTGNGAPASLLTTTQYGAPITWVDVDWNSIGGAAAARGADGAITSEYSPSGAYLAPFVSGRASGAEFGDVINHPIALPGGIVPGEMLVVSFSNDGASGVTLPAGSPWAILNSVAPGTTHRSTLLWKTATGSDDLTVLTELPEQSTHTSARITNARTIQAAVNSGGGTAPAPTPTQPTAAIAARNVGGSDTAAASHAVDLPGAPTTPTTPTGPAPAPVVSASSPAVVTGTGPTALVTAGFNPPAGSVVVAAMLSDPVSSYAVTNNGDALTWRLVDEQVPVEVGLATEGSAHAFWAYLPAGRTGMTVTATRTGGGTSPYHGLKVYVITGADPSNPIGTTVKGRVTDVAPTTSLTTLVSTVTNSLGFVVVDDYTGGSRSTSGVTTSPDTTFAAADIGGQLSGGAGYRALGAAGSAFTVTVDTSVSIAAGDIRKLNWLAFEIKPAPAVGPRVHASSPPIATGDSTALTTAAFNPPADTVLVACVHADPDRTYTITNNGTALTWQVIRQQFGTGSAHAWYAILPASRTGMTVTATGQFADHHGLKLYVVTGADLTDPIGAGAQGHSTQNFLTTAAFTTEAAGSLGFVVGDEFVTAGPTTSPDTTFSAFDVTGQIAGGSGYKQLGAAGTPAAFSLDMAGTGTADWNWLSFEVKAAAGTGGETGGEEGTGPTAALVMFTNDIATVTATTISTGWQSLGTVAQGTTTNHRGTVFYTPDAAAAGALVVDLSVAEEATWAAFLITGGGTPELVTANGGAGTAPQAITPATINPTDGLGDYLALLLVGTDSSTTTTQSVTWPAGWTNPQARNPGVTSSAATFTAERRYDDVSSIAPGTPTLSAAEQWVAFTVAIPDGEPTTGGGGGGGSSTITPPGLTAAGGTVQRLWIAVLAVDTSATPGNAQQVTVPGGFGNLVRGEGGASLNSVLTATADTVSTNTTLQPGPWQLSGPEEWIAWTIAVSGGNDGAGGSLRMFAGTNHDPASVPAAKTIGMTAPTGQAWTLVGIELLPIPVEVELGVIDDIDDPPALEAGRAIGLGQIAEAETVPAVTAAKLVIGPLAEPIEEVEELPALTVYRLPPPLGTPHTVEAAEPITVHRLVPIGVVEEAEDIGDVVAGSTSLGAATMLEIVPQLTVGFGGVDVAASPARRDLPPVVFRGGLRVMAQNIITGQWVHRELPVRGLALTRTLSGPQVIDGSFEHEITDLRDLNLMPWGTWIHVEEAGEIRGSGILRPGAFDASGSLELQAQGVSSYIARIPYTGEFRAIQMDPAEIVRTLWAQVQSFPRGDLGVTVVGSTPVRLGHPETPEVKDAQGNVVTPAREPWQLHGYELPIVGRVVDQLGEETPFEFVEEQGWADTAKNAVWHRIRIGYPRVGNRLDLNLTQGENLLEHAPFEEQDEVYADSAFVQGKGEGQDAITGYAGVDIPSRLRLPRVVTDKTIPTTQLATARAHQEIAAALASVEEVAQVAINVRHENSRWGTFDVGDEVLPRIRLPWLGFFAQWHRITQISYSPDAGIATLKLSRRDAFSSR